MKATSILTLILSTATACLADGDLANLGDPDPDVRIRSLRKLQTSLDPRIPDAVLPLLDDRGDSIRRLAARAIGSRWWQIPAGRVPYFTAALQENARSERDDEQHMAIRALGLLGRSYQKNPMLAPSANKRWVIYERRGLPCLIDTRDGTEELLGYSDDDGESAWFLPAFGNDEIQPETHWHPKKERVALDMLLHRRATTVWLWDHPTGLHKLSQLAAESALLIPAGHIFASSSGLFISFSRWRGDDAIVSVHFSTRTGDDQYFDHKSDLLWSIPSDTVTHLGTRQN